jgi:transposase
MQAATNVTIGLDVGDRYTNVAVVDEAGELIEESRIQTTPAAIRRRFEAEAPARVALGAGTHSPWMSRRWSGKDMTCW